MDLKSIAKASALFLVALASAEARIQYPEPPAQISKDTRTTVDLAVGKLARVTAGQLSLDVNRATLDLLSRIPQADRLYLEQMMFSAFCSSIRDDASMNERTKSAELRRYAQDVRRTLHANPGLAVEGEPGKRTGVTAPAVRNPQSSPGRDTASVKPNTKRESGNGDKKPAGFGTVGGNHEPVLAPASAASQTPTTTSPRPDAAASASSPNSSGGVFDPGNFTSAEVPSSPEPNVYFTQNYQSQGYGLPVTIGELTLQWPYFGRLGINDKFIVSFDYIIVPGNAIRFWVMPEPSQKLKFGYESSGEIVGSGRLSRFFILLEPGEIQSIRLIGKQGEDGPAVVLKTLYLELKVD